MYLWSVVFGFSDSVLFIERLIRFCFFDPPLANLCLAFLGLDCLLLLCFPPFLFSATGGLSPFPDLGLTLFLDFVCWIALSNTPLGDLIFRADFLSSASLSR